MNKNTKKKTRQTATIDKAHTPNNDVIRSDAGNALTNEPAAAQTPDIDRSLPRCWPLEAISPLMAYYHDHEWGVPCHDSQQLFEQLGLEAMQAGLSWNTVLNKRASLDEAFHGFDVERVAAMTPEIPELLENKAIIRNRRKIEAIIHNAQVVLELDMPFADYIWRFAPDGPKTNRPKQWADVPVTTPQAEAMSKAMKADGFKFVGPTIIYAYMQSIGMVNDHCVGCFRCV
ncbi:DNA-3-methyladenine glycosylase I [Bifidobacterium sp. ESL0763]|uniref:DNA-3-methyladenine glycosylase I n=1 Tax=Bifidobacterium sp. ESL0763 TaxID=2983227 RepID=UPI0023F8DEE7|nr:DNA-3-methyladenine glycosylase I [Bifidobacterium sp. ESL0763]MDF7663768.1 DNA-3-methyladenine glycosylase I [Bifidobacterium sp. ESL0763]